MKSVLIIEDDENLLNLFQHHFTKEIGVVFSMANTFSMGVSQIAQKKFDLYIIDINLEGYSGFDILKLLQKEKAITNRVIVMSANDDSNSRIDAYNLGASNFITKPIDFEVLRAIMRKNLKAIDNSNPQSILFNKFTLDLELLKCFELSDNKQIEIPLTKIEFNILLYLAKNIGRVQSKEDLSFRGKDINDSMSFKAIEMHISSLRKKIGSNIIKTKRGFGYYIE